MIALSRRAFVQGLGVVGAGWLPGCGRLPGPGQVQGSEHVRVPRIGFLSLNSIDSAEDETFRQRLRELGYVEGQTAVIEYRSAEGQDERYPALVAELGGLPVDVLVAQGLAAARAAKTITSTVPVAFAGV